MIKRKDLGKSFLAFLLISMLVFPTNLSADSGESFVGHDRYETNFKTVQGIKNPDGIIVASGEDFPDSLSAISLVRITNYPLLLTSKDGFNNNLKKYASQSSIKNIIVVGGKAKCNKFENKNYIYLKGSDRYETNKKVKEYVGKIDNESLGFPIIADAKSYPDSLSASNGLLARKGYLEFDPYSNEVARSVDPYIIGGKIKDTSNIVHVTHLYGRDRYGTNSKAFDSFKYSFKNKNRWVVSSGENFADALSACNVAIVKKCPIKLAKKVERDDYKNYIVGGFKPARKIQSKVKDKVKIKQVRKPITKIGRHGDRGRLYLPSINASVALYDCPPTTSGVERSQRVVDAEDSAAVMEKWFGEGIVIGDHNHQAFRNLKKLSIGDTVYIDDKSGMQTYRCKEIDRNGLNLVTSLIDSKGISAWDKYPLSLYTCNNAYGKSVTIARFVLEKN